MGCSESHRAGLRSFFSFLFGKVDFHSDVQLIETRLQDAIAMKVYFSVINCFEKTVSLVWKESNNAAIRRELVWFDRQTLAARIVLQLSTRRIKGVTNGDVKIFARRVFAWLMTLVQLKLGFICRSSSCYRQTVCGVPDHQFILWDRKIDPYGVKSSLAMVAMRRLYGDPAAQQVVVK